MAGKPVEMIFEFDSVRNFSSMVLHTNNMFSKDVQVSKFACIFLFFILMKLGHMKGVIKTKWFEKSLLSSSNPLNYYKLKKKKRPKKYFT